ncbi:hypothetical protein GRZ55_18120 [Chelativorans sp. ZYF759]|nr:hypothetical protein [Chelativorans sp. ZYF759]
MSMRGGWSGYQSGRHWNFATAGMSALRVTLLFGSAAVAMALILAPIADRHVTSGPSTQSAMNPGIDFMTTGATRQGGTYTERRSVLQASPNSVCIIRDNGMRSGDC